jgi:hypothetical protein
MAVAQTDEGPPPLTSDALVSAVVDKYLQSGDFNGLPGHHIIAHFRVACDELRNILMPLVEAGHLDLNFGDNHPNPHIRAFRDEPIDQQLAKLSTSNSCGFVVYPTASTLQNRVDVSAYADRPFTRRLAFGEPQLGFVSFELPVLDYYRRNPRYVFFSNDIQGWISIGNDAYESEAFPEKHKVLLKAFGFSYDEKMQRAVAVFLRDLARLTPEHQQLWAAHELSGKYALHPDFFRAMIQGDWQIKASLSEAFLEELRTINHMCELIGHKPMFRIVPKERPKELGFLLRSTRRELNEFVLLLDKLMSDNLNVDFFPSANRPYERKSVGGWKGCCAAAR